jgi:adenylosuccinate synthase
MMQGATELALTKLDVLSGMEKIPVCTAYEVDGKKVTVFPSVEELMWAKPVYEKMDGFSGDISSCRKFSDLPGAAQEYVRYIEQSVGCRISYVSVGADREEYIAL